MAKWKDVKTQKTWWHDKDREKMTHRENEVDEEAF